MRTAAVISIVLFFFCCVDGRRHHGGGRHHSLKIFSSLQHNSTGCSDVTIPYPMGAPLTLSCQSRHKTCWKTNADVEDLSRKEDILFDILHISKAQINSLTEKHDGLRLTCEQKSREKITKTLKLNVISPPKVAVDLLEDGRTVQCKVTENWNPELQLCWIFEDTSECQEKHKILREVEDHTDGSKLTCRPELRHRHMISSLTQEAKGYFERMFEEAKKTVVLGIEGAKEAKTIYSSSHSNNKPVIKNQGTNKLVVYRTDSKKISANSNFDVKLLSDPEDNDIIVLKTKRPAAKPYFLLSLAVASVVALMLILVSLLAYKQVKKGSINQENGKATSKYQKLNHENHI